MDEGTKQALFSGIRSILVVIGSVIATHGWATDAMVNEGIGAVMVLLPVAYGIYQKFEAQKLRAAEVAKAVNVGIAIADATVGPTAAIPAAAVPKIIEAVPPAVTVAAPPTSAGILEAVAAATGQPTAKAPA